MDLLQTGREWLAGQLKANASRAVTYQRGLLSVALSASPGTTPFRSDDGYGGSRLEYSDRDYVFTATDLVLGGQVVTPERGDRILEVAGTATLVFEVHPYNNEPPWRWMDPSRVMIRVHAKFIGSK